MWLCLLDLSWPVSTRRLLWRPTAHCSGRKECYIWTFWSIVNWLYAHLSASRRCLSGKRGGGRGRAGRSALLLTGSLANICTAAIWKRWQRQRQSAAIDRQIARQFTIPLWHPTLFAYLLTFNGLLSSHTHRYKHTHAHTQRKLAEIFGAARCANRQTAARFLLQTHYLVRLWVCVSVRVCAWVPVCVCINMCMVDAQHLQCALARCICV